MDNQPSAVADDGAAWLLDDGTAALSRFAALAAEVVKFACVTGRAGGRRRDPYGSRASWLRLALIGGLLPVQCALLLLRLLLLLLAVLDAFLLLLLAFLDTLLPLLLLLLLAFLHALPLLLLALLLLLLALLHALPLLLLALLLLLLALLDTLLLLLLALLLLLLTFLHALLLLLLALLRTGAGLVGPLAATLLAAVALLVGLRLSDYDVLRRQQLGHGRLGHKEETWNDGTCKQNGPDAHGRKTSS
jgi:hypothetical protein